MSMHARDFIGLMIIGLYTAGRLIVFFDKPWNILNLTLVLFLGKVVSSFRKSNRIMPSLLFIGNTGIIADCLFSLERKDLAGFFGSIICLLWIMLPQSKTYSSLKSNVCELASVDDIATLIKVNREALILCCDATSIHSTGVSHLFADLSSEKVAAKSQFGFVDGSHSSLAGKLKVASPIVPTIIQYYEGKEVTRQQVSDPNLDAMKLKFFPYR